MVQGFRTFVFRDNPFIHKSQNNITEEEIQLIQDILNTYASFFDWHMWADLLTDPVAWGLILTLVILEGLLSADNALVLATMVRHLPEEKRKKALMYGLWGAYFFRFVAIGLGTTLAKFGAIKLLGAAYLFWISFKFFKEKFSKKDNAHEEELSDEEQYAKLKKGWLARHIGVFWATVASIELMDIAFSVDSILAAIAISDQVGILILGGMLGILMMRMVAGVFVKLLERVPEMEYTAYVLIALIAAKMALSVAHVHIPHAAFFVIIALSFVGTYIVHKVRKNKANK